MAAARFARDSDRSPGAGRYRQLGSQRRARAVLDGAAGEAGLRESADTRFGYSAWDLTHGCAGFPDWHTCPIIVPAGRTLCSGCQERKQAAAMMGVAVGSLVRVSTVLEDFNAPELTCKCGGDPTSPHHDCSLLHIAWAWRTAHG